MKEINGIQITAIKGDITDMECDAIVNAANNRLWMGGGVAGAIKRKGGITIEQEAVAKGPIEIGEAVHTGAGKLKAKYVIHAAVMGDDRRTDADKIYRATKNSLLLADQLGVRSIAFPALGTGVGGFPYKESAKAMLRAIEELGNSLKNIKQILFVLWGEEAFQAFREVIES
ncbi:macro domain-containing protein [bacterium]|nr:macro domain-containing protein [bacterium]